MPDRSPTEDEAAKAFLAEFFPADFAPGRLTRPEKQILDDALQFVSNGFSDAKMILGLAIDFCVLAEKLTAENDDAIEFQPDLTSDEVLARYGGNQGRNTLTFMIDGTNYGIRAIENKVINLFHGLNRTGYTSAAPHTTGQWERFIETLFLPAFQLSRSGRFTLCNHLIDLGLAQMTGNRFYATRLQRPRLFEAIVREYDRTNRTHENSGAVFQGIGYGYFKADCQHLSLVVDKVRSGSRRQRRFGDIDGYHGLHLEISVEVKDHAITPDNISVIQPFLREVENTKVQGIVFAKSIHEDALPAIAVAGAVPMSEESLLKAVALWDWQKQNIALHGLLHFLSHIEQTPDGVRRLLEFMREKEPDHESVSFLDHLDELDQD
jgi:hypothetical protein